MTHKVQCNEPADFRGSRWSQFYGLTLMLAIWWNSQPKLNWPVWVWMQVFLKLSTNLFYYILSSQIRYFWHQCIKGNGTYCSYSATSRCFQQVFGLVFHVAPSLFWGRFCWSPVSVVCSLAAGYFATFVVGVGLDRREVSGKSKTHSTVAECLFLRPVVWS